MKPEPWAEMTPGGLFHFLISPSVCVVCVCECARARMGVCVCWKTNKRDAYFYPKEHSLTIKPNHLSTFYT